MPRKAFQTQLADLDEGVVALGETIADRLRMAIDALDRDNPALAREVIDGDDEINDRYLELEADCIRLFALQQPVASDLRFVAASFKVLTDLERVGDLAGNLARYAVGAEREVLSEVDLRSIGERTLDLFEDAIEAYAERDPAACRAVAARDDELDDLVGAAGDAVVRELVTADAMATDEDVERVLSDVRRVFLTLRDLERIGDHAVNVAARTLYAVDRDDSLLE
jgi:phosphate transport system protein